MLDWPINHITQVMKLYLLTSLRVLLSALNRKVHAAKIVTKKRLPCCYTLCTNAYSGEYESNSVSIIIVIPAVDNIIGVLSIATAVKFQQHILLKTSE